MMLRARSLAVVAGGSSLALVAGLPFGILVGQAWGWRDAMWILATLAAVPSLSVAALPAVHTPLTGLRDRMRVLSDSCVVGILLGTVTVMKPSFLVIAYLPTILNASGALVVAAMLTFGSGQVLGTTAMPQLIHRRSARFALLVGAGSDADERSRRGRRSARDHDRKRRPTRASHASSGGES